ncbi:RDD family protein [Kitasatospora sp. McL0602]|uniref:RDD family protein n=1 Tax=Kitasatospora sp. McL0602 TaxID=3439530 RepID=UPI003F8CE7A2
MPVPVPVAAVGRRSLAWLVDFALVVGIASLLAIVTFHRIGALVTDVPGLAAKGGWGLLTSRGDYLHTGEGIGIALWHSSVLDVQEAFGALVVCTFAYQYFSIAFGGRTLGKLLLGLRVSGPGTSLPGRGRVALRAAVTTLADVALFSVACCALVGGSFVAAMLVWVLAVVVFWANALPAVIGGRRSLADRAGATTVARIALALPDWNKARQLV